MKLSSGKRISWRNDTTRVMKKQAARSFAEKAMRGKRVQASVEPNLKRQEIGVSFVDVFADHLQLEVQVFLLGLA